MTKVFLTPAFLLSVAASAGTMEDYVRTVGLTQTCPRWLSAPPDPKVSRIAKDLMLSAPASRDFFRRLRVALDDGGADGVIITGARRHQLLVDDWHLELRVLSSPEAARALESKLKPRAELLRADLIEGSEFLRHFGARKFLELSQAYVVATASSLTPLLIPSVAAISAVRERLARDLVEFEKSAMVGVPLSPDNILGRVEACRSTLPYTIEFAGSCLPAAVKLAFREILYGLNFAAGDETTIILRTGAAGVPEWAAQFSKRGYRRVYALDEKGNLRYLAQPPPPSPNAPTKSKTSPDTHVGKRSGRAPQRSPSPVAPSLRSKRR